MKTSQKLKTLTLILVIVLITILSFVGVYKFNSVGGDNLVKTYNAGIDLSGSRLIRMKVDDSTKSVIYDSEGNVVESKDEDSEEEYTTVDEPVNSQDILTKENYKKSYEIVKKRLKYIGNEEYRTRFNEENGEIEIELLDDKLADYALSALNTQGGFSIVDDTTKDVLIDENSIKSVKISLASNGIQYCMDIEFDKAGKDKVRDIINTYVTTTEVVVNDEGEEETVTKEKKANIEIAGSSIGNTSPEILDTDGHMKLYFGQNGATSDELERYKLQTYLRGALIETGKIPVLYKIDQNTYIVSNANKTLINYIALAVLAVEAIIILLLAKAKRILAIIIQIGYIALLMLVLRYTNVIITFEGLAGLILISLINLTFLLRTISLIKNTKDAPAKIVNDNIIKFVNVGIPLIIASIVFCFVIWAEVKSFGNVIFWGYVISLLYNIVFTKSLFKNSEVK